MSAWGVDDSDTRTTRSMNLSVVFPVFNEAENVERLLDGIHGVLRRTSLGIRGRVCR